MTGTVLVGCSGWDDRSWRGAFSPREILVADRFASYAERFATVELNATFDRLPEPSTVDRWHAQAPPGFRYAVKVAQFATHRRKLREPASWVPNHLDRVERRGAYRRVADRLGAWRDEGRDVVAYFDNDQGAAAPSDAAWLRDRMAG